MCSGAFSASSASRRGGVRQGSLDLGLKVVNDDGVETFAGGLGDGGEVAVQIRRGADEELAGVGFFVFFAALAAEGEIVIDGLAESPFDAGDGVGLESDDVAEAGDLAVENPGLGVVLDVCQVALVPRHGCSSFAVTARQRRRERWEIGQR